MQTASSPLFSQEAQLAAYMTWNKGSFPLLPPIPPSHRSIHNNVNPVLIFMHRLFKLLGIAEKLHKFLLLSGQTD